jgi:hypothetical protein
MREIELKLNEDLNPYIQLPDKKVLPKNNYEQIVENFIERALKRGVQIEKDCNDKGCDRHYKIVLGTIKK